eukprot:gene15318-18147_t
MLTHTEYTTVALVRFFSVRSAQEAYNGVYGVLLNEYPVNIGFSKATKTEIHDLKHGECIELMNALVGFNQYSTAIKELVRVMGPEERTLGGPDNMADDDFDFQYEPVVTRQVYACQYDASAVMHLKDGRMVGAVASGLCDDANTMSESLDRARKIAVTNARKALFSKISIVLVDGVALVHTLEDLQQQEQEEVEDIGDEVI